MSRLVKTLAIIWFSAFPPALASQVQECNCYGSRVKEIRIAPLKHTLPQVVLQQMASQLGAVYTRETAAADLERLDRLRIFSSIAIEPVPEPDGVVLHITLKETSPTFPIVSVDVSDENGTSFGPGIKAINLRGRALRLSAVARFGGATNAEIKFENPWIESVPLSYRLEFVARDRYNSLDDFNEESLEWGGVLGRHINRNAYYGGRASLLALKSDVDGIVLSGGDSEDIVGVGGFLGYDSRNLWSNPTNGWFAEIDTSKKVILGGAGDFWEYTLDIQRYREITGRHFLALFSLTTLRSGAVGTDIPVYLNFHLGGSSTVRGWELGASSGKNQFFNTAEYRYQLMRPKSYTFQGFTVYFGMQLALFGDLGIAWDEAPEFAADRFISGAGFGIRFLVPFLDMIRFDFAWGQGGLKSHFGLHDKPYKQRERIR